MDLRGYNYKPEYTSEELDEFSRVVVTSSTSSHPSVVTDLSPDAYCGGVCALP